jgi:colicin import membrane protein
VNAERAAIEKRIEAEDAEWASEREKLKDALRCARA